jgi:hypothetical protein
MDWTRKVNPVNNNAFLKSMNRDYSALMKTNNKVALMTGANRGLGLQTARELGKLGITLLLGVRDVSKSQEAIISILAKNCRGN